ncbi:hypothetical protein BD770DRAFT_349693 [Pilaira anomala]|nr:hypothetical protein BD770DRAFT_349693 [Pilaira anomala]
MPNSVIIDELIHQDTLHRELDRVVAISIDIESAEYVYDWALNNFLNPKTDLVVFLNCRTIDAPMAPYINPTGFIEELDDKKKKKSHMLLRQYADLLKPLGFAVRAIALAGDPKIEIVRKCHELSADVLILGSRELGKIKRALLGSVSDYCSHNCHCTIVIVKAHPDHPEGKHEMKSIYKRHLE